MIKLTTARARFRALMRDADNRTVRNWFLISVVLLVVGGGISFGWIHSNEATTAAQHATSRANRAYEGEKAIAQQQAAISRQQTNVAEQAKAAAAQANAAAIQAKAAAAAAQHAISCINDTLGSRAPLTAADNKAQVDFHNAFTADATSFGTLLTDLLTNAPTSKLDPDFIAYTKIHAHLIQVSKTTSNTLQFDQTSRDKTPLGRC